MVEISEKELADRYLWFCAVGFKRPVLNDPQIIHGTARPEYVDYLITKGMKRWPMSSRDPRNPTDFDPIAA